MRGQAVMFSAEKDEWATPQHFFDVLNAEFNFDLDAAATEDNAKVSLFITASEDALIAHWHDCGRIVWLNPPYSKCRQFIEKAALEARHGCTVVCLVYARTDTRWWHEHVYDASTHQFRPGVEVRFIKGRIKFGGAKAGAPAPSVVIIFRPVEPA